MTLAKEKAATIVSSKLTPIVIAGFVVALAISYVYFANKAVRTVTVMENTKEKFHALSVEVSEMESKKLAIDNKVNHSLAKTLGLVEVQDPSFIVKKTSLSLKTD